MLSKARQGSGRGSPSQMPLRTEGGGARTKRFLDVFRDMRYRSHVKKSRFGSFLRKRRSARQAQNSQASHRQLALRIGGESSSLNRGERRLTPAPSEDPIVKRAPELAEDPDILRALAGKVPSELRRRSGSAPSSSRRGFGRCRIGPITRASGGAARRGMGRGRRPESPLRPIG